MDVSGFQTQTCKITKYPKTLFFCNGINRSGFFHQINPDTIGIGKKVTIRDGGDGSFFLKNVDFSLPIYFE